MITRLFKGLIPLTDQLIGSTDTEGLVTSHNGHSCQACFCFFKTLKATCTTIFLGAGMTDQQTNHQTKHTSDSSTPHHKLCLSGYKKIETNPTNCTCITLKTITRVASPLQLSFLTVKELLAA